MKRYPLLLLFALCACLSTPARADRTVTGAITANGGAVTMSTDGVGTMRFTVLGTWTTTLEVDALKPDGSTWKAPVTFYRTDDGSNAKTTTFTTNLDGKFDPAGYIAVRVIATASMTGTATVSINGSSAVGIVESTQSVPTNLNSVALTGGPLLSTYAFTAVTGTATIVGYFQDVTGAQVSALETYSVTSAVSLTSAHDTFVSVSTSTPLNPLWVTFHMVVSGNAIWVGNGATSTGTLTYSPTTGYPQLPVTPSTVSYYTLGKGN